MEVSGSEGGGRTLSLIRTTAGAPTGQFLTHIFPAATKTVPTIRNCPKEDTELEAFHLTGEHALVGLLVNIRTTFTSCTPASGSCRTTIHRWTSQRNILPWSGCLVLSISAREAQTPRSLPQTKITNKEESTCVHSAESGVAVRVEEASTDGYTRIWSQKLNGTKCARLQKNNITVATWQQDLMWQRSPRTRLVGEDKTSLKFSHWMLMTIAKMNCGKTKHQVKTTKAQMKTRLATWNPPPHVDTQSVLQLHLEDDYLRRCEQCIRLDIRGSMNRLRQNQQVRDVIVNVSRNESRPFGVFINLGRKDSKNWNDVPAHIQAGHREKSPSVQQVEKLFREAKVGDEATEALKHFPCDACGRL